MTPSSPYVRLCKLLSALQPSDAELHVAILAASTQLAVLYKSFRDALSFMTKETEDVLNSKYARLFGSLFCPHAYDLLWLRIEDSYIDKEPTFPQIKKLYHQCLFEIHGEALDKLAKIDGRIYHLQSELCVVLPDYLPKDFLASRHQDIKREISELQKLKLNVEGNYK